MKKKLLTLIIVAISALCCAFAFTACDNKDGGDNGELVVPGNSFIYRETVVEYTDAFYGLSESEQEKQKYWAEDSRAYFASLCEQFTEIIDTYYENGTVEEFADKKSYGVIAYYKIKDDRISFMNRDHSPEQISEGWYEQYFGIIKDNKIFVCGGVSMDDEYYTLYHVYEKI